MEPSLFVGCSWFIFIGFMFFAQHHVCDAYFVPAINVFVERMRKSKVKCLQRWGEEAVAGATICALGCNGPELFSNLISLYTGSDAGIGVVVGSEIFNLLIIIGCATIAAPRSPLEIERVPFARDVAFYALSIGLLYWALLDKSISWLESTTLLSAAAVYVATVYFTTDVVNCVLGHQPTGEKKALPDCRAAGYMHGVEVQVEEIIHSRMVDGRNAGAETEWIMDATAHGIYSEPVQGPNDFVGTKSASGGVRKSIGFQFAKPEQMLGSVLKYKDLKEVLVLAAGVIELEFISTFMHVSLRLTVSDQEKRDQLLRNIEKYSLGRPWVHQYNARPSGAFQHFAHTVGDKDESIMNKIFAFPHLIIDLMLKSTLFAVDVKDIKKEGRWPLCFLGAMAWLAVFSYFMLASAQQIHYNIPVLPESFLGITVCAIGTSFPNAVASILMAQQNKPAAAIANALGSNVQNVFLAMALPWVIYSAQHNCAPIAQNVAGINEGVFWMMGTLVLVVVLVLLPKACTLTTVHGGFLIALYMAYLVMTSGETFKWWPALVN